MDSLEEENPSDIKYEFKKISDMLQWNNFRFTRIEVKKIFSKKFQN